MEDVKDDVLEPITGADLDLTAATMYRRRTLARVMRFLVTIQSHDYVRRARREGYSAAEHRAGWGFWRTAAGEDRPLDHFFAEQQVRSGLDQSTILPVLQKIDAFENLWFPRTRAIIRRVVAADRREEFAGAFFRNLEQQPLGPSVVGSVSTYLARVDGLATAADPAAKEVRAMLAKRGLTQECIGKMRDLLALFEGPDAGPMATAVSPADIDKAQRAQLEAFDGMRDWFNDWATTLRPLYNLRERIQLGLSTVKRRGAAGEELEEEAVEKEPEKGAGDPKQPAPDIA
jgi:hypothetical protein